MISLQKNLFIAFFFFLLVMVCSNTAVFAIDENKTHVINKINSIIEYLENNYNNLNNVDDFLEKAEEVLRLSELNYYLEGKVQGYRFLAIFYYTESRDLALAEKNVNYAISIAEKINNKKILVKVYKTKGAVFIMANKYNKALEVFFKACDYSLESKDTSEYIKNLINVGNIYYRMNFYNDALPYYKKAIEFASESYYPVIMRAVYGNISAIYNEMEEYDESIKYLQKASRITQNIDAKVQANNFNFLVSNYNDLNKHDSALIYGFKALNIADSLGYVRGLAVSHLGIGIAYKGVGSYSEAIYHLEQSLNYAQQVNFIVPILGSSYRLSELYKMQKKHKEALSVFDIYTQYKDSIKSFNDPVDFVSIADKYKHEKVMEGVRKNYNRKAKVISLIIISALLVLLIILLGYRFQKRRSKANIELQEELQEEIKQKDKELLLKIDNIEKKEHFIYLIEYKIKALRRDIDPGLISELITEIKLSKSENMWAEFETRFGLLDDGFIDSIKKKAPNLTPFELRLCSFIRLNLSTNEISEMTNQNRKTINTSRFRLRKKLGLQGSSEKLSDFLQNI